ncbi:MAG: phospholipase D-like domain-containing protein, partial [Kiritimatiellaceae bacterium]|nr:phospholipase D-like domain-containing protein [Kiritimatiellaceae bacterium]
MTSHPLNVILFSVYHLVLFTLITLHCLRRRRNASTTILWIFIAWSFPIIGPILYLSFGIDRVEDLGFQKFLANEHLLNTRKETQTAAPRAYWHNLTAAHPHSPLLKEFDRMLDALQPNHPALAGNVIVPLVNGDNAYPAMLAAIRSAKRHIHLQSFIIGNDAISREFLDALAAKAAKGVQVRLLYDRFGSTRAHLLGLFRSYAGQDNFHIAGWTQANPFKRQFQVNLRNHRKALIIDGKHAFFGGINIHDENTSSHKNGPIRDYHFSVRGLLVQELQYSFLRDWHFITQENPEELLTENYFPDTEPEGDVTARLINSGPSTEKNVATEAFFNGITLAKSQILAVTPYLVPPIEILHALRSAALRGVNVRLVVPKKNNHRYAGLASRAIYEELLQAGVQIHERRSPFMHAKMLLIDNDLSLIGTANLDTR